MLILQIIKQNFCLKHYISYLQISWDTIFCPITHCHNISETFLYLTLIFKSKWWKVNLHEFWNYMTCIRRMSHLAYTPQATTIQQRAVPFWCGPPCCSKTLDLLTIANLIKQRHANLCQHKSHKIVLKHMAPFSMWYNCENPLVSVLRVKLHSDHGHVISPVSRYQVI